jgi:hypothetical protein
MNGLINYTIGVLATQFSKKKRSYFNHHLLLNENLWSLYKKMIGLSEDDSIHVEERHTPIDLNFDLYAIMEKYGVPYCIKKMIINDAIHTIVVYKKKIWGTRSRIVYHFLNGNIIHVNFRFRVTDDQQSTKIKKQLSTLFNIDYHNLTDIAEINFGNKCYAEVECYQDIRVAFYHELSEGKEILKGLFDKTTPRVSSPVRRRESELVF